MFRKFFYEFSRALEVFRNINSPINVFAVNSSDGTILFSLIITKGDMNRKPIDYFG